MTRVDRVMAFFWAKNDAGTITEIAIAVNQNLATLPSCVLVH